jgi:hypothetical protein
MFRPLPGCVPFPHASSVFCWLLASPHRPQCSGKHYRTWFIDNLPNQEPDVARSEPGYLNCEDACQRNLDEMQYIRTDVDRYRLHHDVFMQKSNTPQPDLGFISEKHSYLFFVKFCAVELQFAVANFVESTLFHADCDSGTGYSTSGDSCNKIDAPLQAGNIVLLPLLRVTRAQSTTPTSNATKCL